ncbi:hypothetical protein A6R68_23866, partial [Neotoma lepida]
MATGQKLMRAIRVFEFGGPEVLKLQSNVAVPVPKGHQVLIKVHACGVNPVETYIRSGTYARKPTLPFTPGTDVSGIIESVGDSVSAFKKGNRVFCSNTVSGGYAEFALAEDHTVYTLPETLNFKQGAALGIPYFTACRALFHRWRPSPTFQLVLKLCGFAVTLTGLLREKKMISSSQGPSRKKLGQKGALLATYNSLTDKHLAGYFNNTRIRRHLRRSGLITRSGRILSEKEYKVNTMKQDHQKYIRECLAQAIFHKVLDMERYHQLEIKRRLDTVARKEKTQRLKGEHTRRFIEDNMPVLTPHPPAGPKTNRGCSVLTKEGRSSPLTLGKKAMMKFRNYMDNSQMLDPYQLPDINSYLIPVPPTPLPQAGKISRENRSEPWRRKRLRPITAPNDLEPLYTKYSEHQVTKYQIAYPLFILRFQVSLISNTLFKA